MNIFRVDDDPILAAQMLCNSHVVKMVVESAQMLSTAHRVLDGKIEKRYSKKFRKITYYNHLADHILYKAVHVNHPSTVWTRETSENYIWHYRHFEALCYEYTYRYGKIHETETKLLKFLGKIPTNINVSSETPLKLAMSDHPECQFPNDPVKSYRLFYQTKQDRFKMVWTKRNQPEWFKRRINE
jgi:hypothetical protein